MADTILYRIRCVDVQLLEEVLLSWQTNGRDDQVDHELEEALRVCLGLPANIREVLDATWRRLVAYQVEDTQKTGERLRELFERGLKVMVGVREQASAREHASRPVQRLGDLDEAIEKLKRLNHEFVEGWPWIDEKIIQEAREEYDRGEFQTVREILDEIQGTNP